MGVKHDVFFNSKGSIEGGRGKGSTPLGALRKIEPAIKYAHHLITLSTEIMSLYYYYDYNTPNLYPTHSLPIFKQYNTYAIKEKNNFFFSLFVLACLSIYN